MNGGDPSDGPVGWRRRFVTHKTAVAHLHVWVARYPFVSPLQRLHVFSGPALPIVVSHLLNQLPASQSIPLLAMVQVRLSKKSLQESVPALKN